MTNPVTRETRRQRAATNLAAHLDPTTGPRVRAELLVSLATRWTTRADEARTTDALTATRHAHDVLRYVDPVDHPTVHAALDDDTWRLRWVTVHTPPLVLLRPLVQQLRGHRPDVWHALNTEAHREAQRLQAAEGFRTPRITFATLVDRARDRMVAA